jgi:hypothetical protein
MHASALIVGEKSHWQRIFFDAIPDHAVTLFDKGFWRADFLLRLQQEDVTSGAYA